MPAIERQIRRKDRRNMGMQPCYVCRRYAALTQVHHLVAVAVIKEMRDYADSMGVDVELAYRTVALCPNHHAMFHLCFDRDAFPADVEAWEIDAIERLVEIQNEATERLVSSVFTQIEEARRDQR